MRRFSKLMSILLTLALCLSLLPMSALAEGLEGADEYRDWGPHNVEKPEEKSEEDFANAIKDPLQEKLDKEAIEDSEGLADSLNDKTYDAIYGTETPSGTEDHKTADDVQAGIPEKPEDGTTEPSEPTEPGEPSEPTEPGEPTEPSEPSEPTTPEPPSEDDSVLQRADKAANAAEDFQKAVTDAVTVTETVEDEEGNKTEQTVGTVDEVVGEVVRNEDGTVDTEKSSGLAGEIAQAADAADVAASNAKSALTAAKTAVENRDQGALNTAQAQATEAYGAANTALASANTAYESAKSTVEAAQRAYDDAVKALEAACAG